MINTKSTNFIFAISILFSSLGFIASDLYLPSLPAIAHSLNTTVNLAQLSVAFFILGFSVPRLLFGPISDAVGRKKPLVIGLIVCLIG